MIQDVFFFLFLFFCFFFCFQQFQILFQYPAVVRDLSVCKIRKIQISSFNKTAFIKQFVSSFELMNNFFSRKKNQPVKRHDLIQCNDANYRQ